MTTFLIILIIITIILTVLFLLCIASVAVSGHYDFDEVKPILLEGMIGVLIISIILSSLYTVAFNVDTTEYNNGICTECGGELTLFDIERGSRNYYNVTYYYQCDECGHIVQTITSME